MWPKPPEDLVTFTEEILNRKLHVLCSVSRKIFTQKVVDPNVQPYDVSNISFSVQLRLKIYCNIRSRGKKLRMVYLPWARFATLTFCQTWRIQRVIQMTKNINSSISQKPQDCYHWTKIKPLFRQAIFYHSNSLLTWSVCHSVNLVVFHRLFFEMWCVARFGTICAI